MYDLPDAFPLAWPAGVARTPDGERRRAKFGVKRESPNGIGGSYSLRGDLTLAQAVRRVLDELRRMGIDRCVVSTNARLKRDGLPASDQPKIADPGAAVYFNLKRRPYCLPCDRWDRLPDNLAAIAAHVAAMRGMERWGVGSVEQSFAGYLALAPPASDWRCVFGVERAPSVIALMAPDGKDNFRRAVKAVYHDRVRACHPDSTPEGQDRSAREKELATLNAAWEAFEAEVDG